MGFSQKIWLHKTCRIVVNVTVCSYLFTNSISISVGRDFIFVATVETVPYPVLLNTPPFQSALHVFAGVGGLALLAEHLPLLYPEITRQVTPPEVTREVGSSSTGIGHDWVTLEANEDMYEVGYVTLVFVAFYHMS